MKKIKSIIKLSVLIGFVTLTSCAEEEPTCDCNSATTTNSGISSVDLLGTWNISEKYTETNGVKTSIQLPSSNTPTSEIECNLWDGYMPTLTFSDNTIAVSREEYYWNPTSNTAENDAYEYAFFYQIVDNTITWDGDEVAEIKIVNNKLHIADADIEYDNGNLTYTYSVYTKN